MPSGKKEWQTCARGRLAIAPEFDDASSFYEGLAGVELGGKWGFIDPKGEFAVNPQFNDLGGFGNGLEPV